MAAANGYVEVPNPQLVGPSRFILGPGRDKGYAVFGRDHLKLEATCWIS